MDRIWIAVLFVLAVALCLHWVTRPRRQFVIVIRDGRVASVSGSAPQRFVEDVERVCAFWGIRNGKLVGVKHRGRVRLAVAGGIEAKHAQTFQNAWENPI